MTEKQNAPGLVEQAEGAHDTSKRPNSTGLRLSPRQARVLNALVDATGWLWREQIDRIAKASNGPDVVMKLRAKLGHDAIDTQRVDITDADGRPSNPGRYRLTGTGRQRLAQAKGGAR